MRKQTYKVLRNFIAVIKNTEKILENRSFLKSPQLTMLLYPRLYYYTVEHKNNLYYTQIKNIRKFFLGVINMVFTTSVILFTFLLQN